ncbi:C39 family peptidase [Exiguobacterium sp. s189]|uniref:C39 family peptidase n=1 Tax=Exiguobacterium sp. s189 TaxID=2751263 RepID=UPI001BEAD3BA|nr:C39 family peptidase [Exiguobacterium sp. s189]
MRWKTYTKISIVVGSLVMLPLITHAEGSFEQRNVGIIYTSNDGSVLTGWQQIDGNTYYLNENGTVITGWQQINNATYFFEADGRLVTRTVSIEGKTYHFAEDGKLLTGWQTFNGQVYYFDATGIPIPGFQSIDGKRYYFSNDGMRLSGWQQIAGAKHYIFSDGTIRTGVYTLGGKSYFLLNDGKVATGWQTLGARRYYFGDDGARRQGLTRIDNQVYGLHPTYGYLLSGLYKIDSHYYLFDTRGKRQYGLQKVNGKTVGFHPTSGYRLTGKFKIGKHTYFFDSNGIQQTGWRYSTSYEYFAPALTKKTDWQSINGKWYFFDSNGRMYQNKRVGNAKFDAKGVYSRTMPVYKMNVPLYRQFPMGYPSGCEFFSLKMALEKKGRVVSASTLYREMPKSVWNARYENRSYRWVDPNVMFTGDPRKKLSKYKNYGIYPKGMVGFASKYRPVKDVSNQGISSIERELSMGNPVIVWASVDFKKPYGYFSWYTSSKKKYTGFTNYHVMLATGYDQSTFYINDPYRGRLVVPKAKVKAVMGATGWKALSVR